jgi:hypothetical protein
LIAAGASGAVTVTDWASADADANSGTAALASRTRRIIGYSISIAVRFPAEREG